MDIHLPYEDPYQTLSKMRQHPRLRDTRIVAISAMAIARKIARVRVPVSMACLRKPFDTINSQSRFVACWPVRLSGHDRRGRSATHPPHSRTSTITPSSAHA